MRIVTTSAAALLVASASVLASCVAPQRATKDASSAESPAPEAVRSQDLLRGSITPERAWWDVLHYDLALQIFPETKSLRGSNVVSFKALAAGRRMQVDLQPPLRITRVSHGGANAAFEREGNVYWVDLTREVPAGALNEIQIFYEGTPIEAAKPPWEAGFTWDTDEHGKPFIATTCQGDGASIWWPNKDHGYDEPDSGMDIRVTVPEALTAVSNGRLQETLDDPVAGTRTFHWKVLNPINNYGVNVNVGNYVSMSTTYEGEGGVLDLEYWVLERQQEIARKHFEEVPRTLAAMEHWFGKYPFYEDSYKLVVVPYLGMEHQSSVTYGNGFENGYRGRDLSKTGIGLKFDFIIVHESAHEWFGNNVSMKDAADMWIHESFANYSENLFVEFHFTEAEAQDYVIGCRAGVANDRPIIGTYDRNQEGSTDMYNKGGNMLHTMRHVLNDDVKWRAILRGINRDFWHSTVTTDEVESYISEHAGFDFGPLFDQYLRTTDIPVLKYTSRGKSVTVWWDEVVPGFTLPVLLRINGEEHRVTVSEEPLEIDLAADLETFELDRNFYMTVEAEGGA